MKKKIISGLFTLILVIALIAAPVVADTVVVTDDFNRADGPLGSNWTTVNIAMEISGNRAGTSGSHTGGWYAATYNGVTGNIVEGDVYHNGSNGGWIGFLMDHLATNNTIIIAVKDHYGSGGFDSMRVFDEFGGSAVKTWLPGEFGNNFTSAHMKVELVGGMLNITFSNINPGGGTRQYSHDLSGILPTGGTGVGIIGYKLAQIDNFSVSTTLAEGKLFMVDGYNSTIYELSPSTGAVLNTIPTPTATDGGGDGLAYGNGRMFFTTIETNDIYEINPSNGTILNQFTGPVTWEGIDALGFSGDKLYALEYGENATIHVLDPDTGANITTLEPGIPLVGGLTFAGTRDSLFVSNSEGEPFPSFGMTNQGFEAGDFAGWTVYEGLSGNASVETSFDAYYFVSGEQDPQYYSTYYAYCGDYFAVLEAGNETQDTSISQDFTINAGETIEGWAFFNTQEAGNETQYNDECSVDIMDGATLVQRVFFSDTWDTNWPATPWTYWSWTASSAGTYTLVARVVNIEDSGVPSYMGLDIPEEEPTTIYEIDDETGVVLNSFPAPIGPGEGLYGLGFSSSRNTLFLGFYENNMVYEVDPDTGEIINSFEGPEGTAISALAADEFVSGEPPTVDITKKANPTTLPEPGGVFTFTLNITNTSVEPVTVTNLTDDNDLSAGCLALIGEVLDPGEWVSCTYNVTHNDTGTYNNTVEVTVEDNEGNPASDSDDETVTVTSVGPTLVEIDKYWSKCDVCFARDMDRDGEIDENSPECYYLGATSNGTPLDTVCGSYTLKAVIKKGKVKSYNPGQFYAVSTITVLEDLDSLLITENYEDIILSGLGVLNPAKGGGSVVVVKMDGDIPVQILDGKSDEVYVGPSGASIQLEDVEAGDIFKVYVKFAPGMKGEPFILTGPWTNTSYANAEAGDNQQIAEASASIIVLDPAE